MLSYTGELPLAVLDTRLSDPLTAFSSETRVTLDLGGGYVAVMYSDSTWREESESIPVYYNVVHSDRPTQIVDQGIISFPPMTSFLTPGDDENNAFRAVTPQPWRSAKLAAGISVLGLGDHSQQGMMMAIAKWENGKLSLGPAVVPTDQGSFNDPNSENTSHWVGYNTIGNQGTDDTMSIANWMILPYGTDRFYVLAWNYALTQVAYRTYSVDGSIITARTGWNRFPVQGSSSARTQSYYGASALLLNEGTAIIVTCDPSVGMHTTRIDLRSSIATQVVHGISNTGSTFSAPVRTRQGSVQFFSYPNDSGAPDLERGSVLVEVTMPDLNARTTPLAQVAGGADSYGFPLGGFYYGGANSVCSQPLPGPLPGPVWNYPGTYWEPGTYGSASPTRYETVVGMAGLGRGELSYRHPYSGYPEYWDDTAPGLDCVLVTATHLVVWRHFGPNDAVFLFYRYRSGDDLNDGQHTKKGFFS